MRTCLLEQTREHPDATVLAEMMRRALRPAGEAEQPAIVADQCQVGLRVPAVDGQGNRHTATASSASRSSRSSLSSYCAISGCVSSAFFAVTGSRVTAASAVSRSYAATC